MTTVKPPQGLRPATTLSRADMKQQAQTIKDQIQQNTGLLQQLSAKKAEELEKKGQIKEKKRKEELKKLKQLAKKCNIKKGETAEKGVGKLVKGILSERFDQRSKGFLQMAKDLTDFINNDDGLSKDFHKIVGVMQEQV